MDLLEQYEKQNPQPVQMAPQRQLTSEHGFFIRLVTRLFGGRIENARQASYVLLGAAGVIMLAAALVFFGVFGSSSGVKPPYSTDPLHSPPGAGQ